MSEASGSASPAPSAAGGGATPGMRPKRAVRPTVKALLAREQSPDGWEHGGTRRSQPSRPIRTSSGARPQIKLKMKASGGGTAAGVGQGPKTQAYMQSYDRELDSEDDETGEGLAFEEQLIFRMPEGLECDKLREAIQKRQLADDVWFKFKDSRRAVVHVGDSLFSAKLVDLPTITESHKTLDNRQFFKVADITQMLVVEGKIADESQASSSAAGKGFNIEDFIYPHGITPPMHWARKRRFRKRAARRAIETVEKEVERLLKADKKAEQIEYEMIDAVEEGGSEDDEDDQRGGPSRRSAASPGESQAETPMPDGSDAGSQDEDEDEGDEDAGGGGQARRRDMDEDRGEGGYDDEDADDDDVDEDLAAELDAALEEEEDDEDDDGESTRGAGSEAQSHASDQEDLWDDDDDDDADDADEEDEDEEDENDEEKEQRVREAQLEAECRELETLVRRKQADVDGTMNLIIKNRHQQALRKLTTERDLKRNQLADLKQARKERKEANQAAEQAAEQAAAASSNVDDDGDAISTHGDEMPNQPSPGDSASAAVAGVSSQDAQSVSQNRGMPPPALPASRNPPQSSHSAGPEASISASNQPSAQADHGDNDLWDDDDEEEDNEE
ncbi:related to TAF7 - TFIID subunit (TBP-associated factor), 67 kD [Melanopsichium pennsylvanicum]|uniref:Related to TAF7 - TFIID subunit (TBP-associated factor), 67 kD n=1 Tax=Melanopsichium pennsylvanicum TaxID=63383 RepID=A0AAJ5C3B0_9BASI|nr:related to TAF7 - TFIID subunit (TBP-associated factor), 67 kD [Melanopsichium pennsylvanicum]